MYNKILVAYDGSEFSKAALVEAAQWVKKHGGEIIMVHAVYFFEEEFIVAPEQREKQIEYGKKICYQAKETLTSEFGLTVDYIICEGDPHEIIIDIAREKTVDLIAMGTYGRRGIKRIILGSVTSKIISEAPCDVLVVKKPCSECKGEYKSILVPFDGSEFSQRALIKACELSKIDGAEVTVLYVIPRYEEMIEFLSTPAIKKALIFEAEKILEKAKAIAADQGVSIATTIAEGHTSDKIVEISKILMKDLIVIGTYGWKGISKAIIGSTTERVIVNAPCPVLTVK